MPSSDEELQNGFSGLSPSEYHQWHITSELFEKVETTWFAGLLPPGAQSRILDLGCGTGIWTCALADTHPDAEVIGVDISAKMVEFARSICGNKATFVRADAVTFSDAARFSLIVSVLSADYIGFVGTADSIAVNLSPNGSAHIFFMDPLRYTLKDNQRIKTWCVAQRKLVVAVPDYTVIGARACFTRRGLLCDHYSFAVNLSDGISRIAHCFVCRFPETSSRQ